MNRPIRSFVEKTTSNIPSGPAGYAGDGNLVGAVTYFAVSIANKFNPIAGSNIGFKVNSHSTEQVDGGEVHTFIVTSYLEPTAKFIGKFRSPPTNIDFFTKETEVLEVEPVNERRTATTWMVKVRTNGREAIEEAEEMI